jgi:Tfp pilus assembly PilM family ATPase
LARSDEITSTEKLLNVIRQGSEKPSEEAQATAGTPLPQGSPLPQGPGPARKVHKFSTGTIMPVQRSVTVGVDIGHEYLRLVKATRTSEGKWKVLDFRSVGLAGIGPTGSPEFGAFLKSELTDFCGSAKKLQVWVIMSAAEVDVHHVRIPRVAKKEIANAVYWTVKKESPFEDKETVFDFEVQGDAVDQGIRKFSVMAYTAPLQKVEEIRRLFSRIGIGLAGISTTPFAVQNIFRTGWIPTMDETVASLFIGNDFSRIDIYSNGNLAMTRGIKAGANSMVESLMEVFNERGRQRAGIETVAMSLEQARKVLYSLSSDSAPLEETDAGYGLTKDEIFEMALPALGRLSRQIERTFEYYTMNQGETAVRMVYVSGVMNVYEPLVEYIGDQLGVRRDIWDPLGDEIGVLGSPAGAISISERTAFVPAFGIALSDNSHTPNLLFTYRDKEVAQSVTKINWAIFIIFLVSVAVSSGIFFYQRVAIDRKKMEASKLEHQLSLFSPRADKSTILQAVVKGKQFLQTSKALTDNYLGLSALNELSALTPASIRLINVKMNFGASLSGAQLSKQDGKEPPKEAGKEGQPTRKENILLEGLIFGDPKTLESSLTGYVLKLDGSPMFRQVNVLKSSVERFKNGEVMHFVIDLKVG